MTDGGVPYDLSTEAASRRRKPVGEVGTTDDGAGLLAVQVGNG